MKNSFADYIIDKFNIDYLQKIWSKNNNISPYDISYGSNKKYLFKCINNEHHEFPRLAYLYLKTQKCPICEREKNSVGVKYPDSFDCWSDRNETTPLNHSSMSGDVVLWKCQNGVHEDYKRSIKNSVYSNFECPKCRKPKSHPNMANRLKLEGRVFGELTVMSFCKTKHGISYWNCLCSCGSKVIKPGSDLISGKITTCGNKSWHNIGENNPNWRGGVTEINYSERYTKEYAQWHSDVLKKDGYTCQCCGQYSGDLQVHHIFLPIKN